MIDSSVFEYVRDAWRDLSNKDESLRAQLPPKDVVLRMITTAYQASTQTEEGEFHPLRLAYLSTIWESSASSWS